MEGRVKSQKSKVKSRLPNRYSLSVSVLQWQVLNFKD